MFCSVAVEVCASQADASAPESTQFDRCVVRGVLWRMPRHAQAWRSKHPAGIEHAFAESLLIEVPVAGAYWHVADPAVCEWIPPDVQVARMAITALNGGLCCGDQVWAL